MKATDLTIVSKKKSRNRHLIFFILVILCVGFIPTPTKAATTITGFDVNPKVVPIGKQSLIFNFSVNGLRNDLCEKSADLYLHIYSDDGEYPSFSGFDLDVDKKIDNLNSSTVQWNPTLEKEFESDTFYVFVGTVGCVSKLGRVTQTFNVSSPVSVRTQGSTGGAIIKKTDLLGSWRSKAKTYIVSDKATSIDITLQEIKLEIISSQPRQYLEKRDLVIEADGSTHRLDVKGFGVAIDRFGRSFEDWECNTDTVFKICFFPVKKNLDSNPSSSVSVNIPFNSDFPVTEKDKKDGFGITVIPLIRTGATSVDFPFITDGQIVIKFDSDLPPGEQEEEGGPGEGSGTGDIDVNGSVSRNDEGAGGFIVSLVNIILGILIAILRWIVWVLGVVIFVPLLENTLTLQAGEAAGNVILVGWGLARDLVNMFFILILIVIGFGTMLKIEAYNYKKLLVNLIVMALLVNFSLLIGRIIMQLADTIQFSILPQSETVSTVREMFSALSTVHVLSLFDGLRGFTFSGSGALTQTFTLIFQFVLELMVIFTFGALAIFMLIRTLAIWILLIISPFAYGLMILPVTSSYAKKWWSNFIKYALFAPIIAFFFKLSTELYTKGLKIFPNIAVWSDREDLVSNVKSLSANGLMDFNQALELGLVYVVILAFLWAGMIVTKQMGIAGAGAIVGLAEKGLKAPFVYAGKGLKKGAGAALNLAQEKLLEKTGVETRLHKWVEGWKESRKKSTEAREARGAGLALDRKSALASPVTFFQRYWNPQGIGRVLKGGDKKGREFLGDAKKLRKEAAAEAKPYNDKIAEAKTLRFQSEELSTQAEGETGFKKVDLQARALALNEKADQIEKEAAGLADALKESKEKIRQANVLEFQAKKLIVPDDYFTQQKIRSSMNEEGQTIHTDNWNELVDLFHGAEREGKPMRAAAIYQHLAKTYNENELINSTRYTRRMLANESADGKEHQEGEFMTYSAAGAENFRKLILEEKLGLGRSASMMIASDISDIAEKTNHLEIMRMYTSENGDMRLKTPDEREPEISAEKDKMSTGKVLGEANRLVGFREIPDADYDVTGNRRSEIEDHQIAYYIKNYAAVKFLLNRGAMNPSQAKAVAEEHNSQKVLAAAALLDDTEIVEAIQGVDMKGKRETRRNQYLEIMNQLIRYGKTKGEGLSGKSKIDEVQEFFKGKSP